MKIGILTQRHILGFGVDLVVHKSAQLLTNFGHEVTVLANVASEDFPGINYSVIPVPVELHPAPKKELYNSKLYKALVSNFDFDVLIFHTLPFFYSLNDFPNIPKMVIEYGTSDTLFFPLHNKIFFHLNEYLTYNIYYPHADIICPISKYLQSNLPNHLKNKTSVVHLGIDHYQVQEHSQEEIETTRKELNISHDDIILLYVGRLNYEKQPYKNTRKLLQMYRELKGRESRIKLIMIGYGEESDRAYLKQQGVIPLLNVPFNKMSLYYQMSNIYVTATLWEGFDLPLLEAQFFGKPVVAYSVGAHPEVCLNNRTGFLVASPQEFKKKVLSIANNPMIYRYLSENGKTFAQQFTWEKTVRQYEKHLYSIVSCYSNSRFQKSISKKRPFISIIIPNYNSPREMLEKCLQSIKKQTFSNYEIILVDNNSQDKSYLKLCEKYSTNLSLIQNQQNNGFSAAINRGIEKARGNWLLLLNYDTFISPYCLESFVKNLPENCKDIAGYAPKMYLSNEYRVIDSMGTGLNSYAEAYNVGIGEIDVGQYDRMQQVFGVCFGGAFVQKKAFDFIGLLDESYGMYYEDVDWCLRAHLLGFSFYTMPYSHIHHYHSASLRNVFYNWKYEFIELNLLKTAYKNFSSKNLGRALLKRFHSYHVQKKNGNSVFLHNNYNIVKKFDQKMGILNQQREIIQERKITTEDKALHYSPPPKNFFNPQDYSCQYSIENLLKSLERKMKNQLLGPADYQVWLLLQQVRNGEISLNRAKEIFNSSNRHDIYNKILFNLMPDSFECERQFHFIPGLIFEQTHTCFPRGILKGVSLWVLNHNRKNPGFILCEIFYNNDYTSCLVPLPDTLNDRWIKFPFELLVEADKFAMRFSFQGSGHRENTPSPGMSESPLYPFTKTRSNKISFSGNIVVKYHFSA